MSVSRARWNVAALPPREHLKRLSQVDRLVVQLLYSRGITEPSAVHAFLTHQPPLSPDPFQLPDMEPAVDRIAHAVRSGESIAVYGDYDADGVTATVLLTEALRAMGASRVQPYIPHRTQEGYGLNIAAVEELAAQGNRLLITADCGIRGVKQIAHANSLGVDVIVTDHHSTGPVLPPALALIDPKRAESQYPDQSLAGVGVAYKLVEALVQSGLSMEGQRRMVFWTWWHWALSPTWLLCWTRTARWLPADWWSSIALGGRASLHS